MDLDADTRFTEDQHLISRVANLYLQPKDKQLLSQILAIPEEKIQYTVAEYKKLKSMAPDYFGYQTKRPGDGEVKIVRSMIEPLYFYAFTIDRYLNFIRQLWFEVQNMHQIDQMKLSRLDHQIFPPDFRIWPLHDKRQWAGGYPEPSGLALGARYVQDRNTTRHKTNAELQADEAFLLSSQAFFLLISITQGLFIVNSNVWCNQFVMDIKRLWSSPANGMYVNQTLKQSCLLQALPEQIIVEYAKEIQPNGDSGGAISYFHKDDKKNEIKSISWQNIADFMEKEPKNHWMKFCVKLSNALVDSRVNQDLNSFYGELQKFYMQKRNISTVEIDQRNPFDVLNYRNRLSGYTNTFNCGQGMAPRFIGYDGREYPFQQAVIVRDGQSYLNTAIIDPDRSTCAPLLPVNFSASIRPRSHLRARRSGHKKKHGKVKGKSKSRTKSKGKHARRS